MKAAEFITQKRMAELRDHKVAHSNCLALADGGAQIGFLAFVPGFAQRAETIRTIASEGGLTLDDEQLAKTMNSLSRFGATLFSSQTVPGKKFPARDVHTYLSLLQLMVPETETAIHEAVVQSNATLKLEPLSDRAQVAQKLPELLASLSTERKR